MACNLATVDVAPCGLVYNSSRKQQEALLLLLCAVLNSVDGPFSCGDWSAILTLAENNGLVCLPQGMNNAKQAQIVCDGLGVDCTDLQCFSDQDLAAMRTYLTCRITSALNP